MMFGLYMWYCGNEPMLLGLYTDQEKALQAGKDYKASLIERKDYDAYDPEFDDLVVCNIPVDQPAGMSLRTDYTYI